MNELYGSRIIKFLIITMLQNILIEANAETCYFTDPSRPDFFTQFI